MDYKNNEVDVLFVIMSHIGQLVPILKLNMKILELSNVIEILESFFINCDKWYEDEQIIWWEYDDNDDDCENLEN